MSEARGVAPPGVTGRFCRWPPPAAGRLFIFSLRLRKRERVCVCMCALAASRHTGSRAVQVQCCELDGVQCSAGCRHEAGRWAARGGSCELCVDWSGHRVTRPMVNGRRPSGTEGFGWRSQPIPCTCARCPGSDPRLPCWSSACLPSLSLIIHQAHSESHIPSLHHNPSHPSRAPRRTPSNHPNPITPRPHIPQTRPPIICPLHPEFRLSPPAPINRALR